MLIGLVSVEIFITFSLYSFLHYYKLCKVNKKVENRFTTYIIVVNMDCIYERLIDSKIEYKWDVIKVFTEMF